MSEEEHAGPLDHPEVQSSSGIYYGAAFAVALCAMQVACGLVLVLNLSEAAMLAILAVITFGAVMVQLYLLFKLDIHPNRIWHTTALVATLPLLFMSIGLTLWMFDMLAERTMLGGG